MMIRERVFKLSALTVLLGMIYQICFPFVSFALTSGPSQPEVQSFEPIGTSEMVGLFTGDFTYNIPLFDLPGPNGGYPFNLAYHSGIGMDQEATWVGLGWNLNPGAILRQMRGLPDDLKGLPIKNTRDLKLSRSFGLGVNAGVEIFGGDLAKVGLGLKVYYNNYKGIGYTLNTGLDFHASTKGGLTAGVGLNFSMDSQEGIGVGVEPSLSLSHRLTNDQKRVEGRGTATISASIDSRRGLTDLSMGYRTQTLRNQDRRGNSTGRVYASASGGGTSRLSFSNSTYTPQIRMPLQGYNLSVVVKPGAAAFGVFGNISLSGFYSEQSLKNRNEEIESNGYGYLYMDSAENGTDVVTDFNREKDGMIRRISPNLAIPSMSYDIYTVQGQGIGGMFRPYRSDIGVLFDPYVKSETYDGAAGVDIGPGPSPHFGVNGSLSYSVSENKKWKADNKVYAAGNELYKFSAVKEGDPLYEPFYFKAHGELTADSSKVVDYVGQEDAVRIDLDRTGDDFRKKYRLEDKLVTNRYSSFAISHERAIRAIRKPRQMTIQAITNDDLLENPNLFPEFDIWHYEYYEDEDGEKKIRKVEFDREKTDLRDQSAGFTSLNADGYRYVYALPTYNNEHVEYQFSVAQSESDCTPIVHNYLDSSGKLKYKVSGTDEYYNRTKLPPYAYAYLLTSIASPDYIDADDIPGPSDGDFGYWVKLNYVKTSNDYKWRVPFLGANYIKGYDSKQDDDKGTFVYGSKEIWHLKSAETKTHIAEFEISGRKDASGAKWEFQTDTSRVVVDQHSYKLDKISLFSKRERYEPDGLVNEEALPIKTVHFDYTYELCPEIVNFDSTVTDKRVQNWYGYSTSPALRVRERPGNGKLTLKKLWFTYEKNTRGALSPYVFDYYDKGTDDIYNPKYNTHAYDRWGNYKPEGDNICENIDFPYVAQSLDYNDDGNVDQQDTLDRDRDASVWNLKKIRLPSGGVINIDYESDDYAFVQNKVAMQMTEISGIGGPTLNEISSLNDKVYFKLESPIPADSSDTFVANEISKYFDETKQVYFKVQINLDASGSKNEIVAGYADVKDFGFDRIPNSSSTGDSIVAWVKLAASHNNEYHPFSLAAAQHIRTNQPELAFDAGKLIDDDVSSKKKVIKVVQNLALLIPRVVQSFVDFHKFVFETLKVGTEVQLGKSWLRLNSPDRVKYGGGVRVKKITLNDSWYEMTNELEDSSTYGHVYSYRLEDGTSSGVAAYEPMIGGDEIAIRRAKNFPEEIPFLTDNNHYFEYPTNESYYPAATVGYSRVTVKSLAAHRASLTDGNSDKLHGTPTTGATIYEFYTAKDFPVIAKETHIDKRPFDLFIPVPLLGQITVNNLTASQGYSIVLNDMHGKLKRVSNHRQDQRGKVVEEPISWVKYNYKTKYGELDNRVPVLLTDGKIDSLSMGVDYEFFTDMRQSTTQSFNGGVNLNTDVLILGIFVLPAFTPWPNIGKTSNEVRTAVTNKIIHKAGILINTEAYDGSSIVKTENILFDGLTGRPLLTSVTNNFDRPIYNYEFPAYWTYEGMGPAYKNIGLTFSALFSRHSLNLYKLKGASHNGSGISFNDLKDVLVPGDEFIIRGIFEDDREESRKAIFMGYMGGLVFHVDKEITNVLNPFKMRLIRSGRRNLLEATAGNITALINPSFENRQTEICSQAIQVPSEIATKKKVPSDCAKLAFELFNSLIQRKQYKTDLSRFYNLNKSYKKCFGKFHIVEIANDLITFSTTEEKDAKKCYIVFYDENGRPLAISTVKEFSQPYYVETTPFTNRPSGSAFFSNLAVKILKTDSSKPVTAYIFSDCKFIDIKEISVDPYVEYENKSLTIELMKMDSVLQASAVTFSDDWPQDYRDVRFIGNVVDAKNQLQSLKVKNPYLKGEKGIWRPHKFYVYVDERSQSDSLDISKDGIFNDMVLFDWVSPLFLNCASKWKLTNEITKYSPYGFELENKDILGRYSSALYGYRGAVTTAVASNTKYSEMGYESFEEFVPDSRVNWYNSGSGNIDVLNEEIPGEVTLYTEYDVLWGNGQLAIANKPFISSAGAANVKVNATSRAWSGEPAYFSTGIYHVQRHFQDASGNSILLFDRIPDAYNSLATGYWNGSVQYSRNFTPASPNASRVSISNDKAHTGKNSLKVEILANFKQNQLKLSPGKDYVFSAWVSQDSTNVPTFRSLEFPLALGAQIDFFDATGARIGETPPILPDGPIVEGWQKMETIFTPPDRTSNIVLRFTSAFEMTVGFSPGAITVDEEGNIIDSEGTILTGEVTTYPTYVDDIRIFPATGNMQSYVYDNQNFRLIAVLDNNNYATLYSYDEQGNLYLVRKETVRGIVSVQESRTHQSELNMKILADEIK